MCVSKREKGRGEPSFKMAVGEDYGAALKQGSFQEVKGSSSSPSLLVLLVLLVLHARNRPLMPLAVQPRINWLPAVP